MSVPPDKWLVDYERKIVTMWTVCAFITYAVIVCAVIGMLMVWDGPMSGSGMSAHTKKLNGTEGAAAVDLRPEYTTASERSDQQAVQSRMTGSASAQ